MKKHIHADLIKAWADGAEVQAKSDSGDWVDIDSPAWITSTKYRIKPEEKKPVVRWLCWVKGSNGSYAINTNPMTQEQIDLNVSSGRNVIPIEATRTEFPE